MLFFGIADMVAALVLLAQPYNFSVPAGLIFAFAVFLLLKGFIFFRDIGSLLDIGAGILLIVTLSVVPPSPILFIIAGLLGLKGCLSLFARF